MSEDRFVVYQGQKARNPRNPIRVVREDGTAFHVIEHDDFHRDERGEALPLIDAISEAFRRADRPLPSTT